LGRSDSDEKWVHFISPILPVEAEAEFAAICAATATIASFYAFVEPKSGLRNSTKLSQIPSRIQSHGISIAVDLVTSSRFCEGGNHGLYETLSNPTQDTFEVPTLAKNARVGQPLLR
jgi:hypothetical protein